MANEYQKWVQRALDIAVQRKKVLAIEGQDELDIMSPWMENRLGPLWMDHVELVNAEDRPSLLKGLRRLAVEGHALRGDIFGIADRDEWEPAEITALQAELPTLLVNRQRHSLESYFCDPNEIEVVLLARDASTGAAQFTPHIAAFKAMLEAARADYVAHWSLGRTIQRANERIRKDENYPIHFRDTCPLPADADIEKKLKDWAEVLDPDALMKSFKALQAASLARPAAEQFRSCVECKLFVGKVVVAGASGLNRMEHHDAKNWMIYLARWSPAMPADLEAVLQPVLV